MESNERRAAKRLDVQLTGTVTLDIEGRKVEGKVTTKNISAYGAYLLTDTCPRVGERVILRLQGASKPNKPQITLQTIGTVLRFDQLSEKTWGFAVKLDEILDLGER
jgi:hypothetical protein